jgi:uncharacterized membrane protein YqhA
MLQRLLAQSRFIVLIGIVASFVLATAMALFGVVDTVQSIIEITAVGVNEKTVKAFILDSIELVDLFLLSTVLYIVAVGLYELFIDDTIPVPRWLEIHTLDDLKNKLVAVVIVVLGVSFLGQVLTWDGTRDLLGLGIAIGAVVAALTFFLTQKDKKGEGKDKSQPVNQEK